jgi:AraC-like DNA-binding protein
MWARHSFACAFGGDVSACPFVPATVLDHFWRSPALDPCGAFRRWLHEFAVSFEQLHPPTSASRAARLIRETFDRRWSVAPLAKRVHTTPSQLRRHFVRDYGITVREYQRAVRMVAALKQVSHGKIDAIALQVGYRSRKNFNEAFRQVTGLTPSAFRLLTEDGAADVLDSIVRVPARRRGGIKGSQSV